MQNFLQTVALTVVLRRTVVLESIDRHLFWSLTEAFGPTNQYFRVETAYRPLTMTHKLTSY